MIYCYDLFWGRYFKDDRNFGAVFDPLPLPSAFRQYIVTALLEPFLPLPPSPLRSFLKYAPLRQSYLKNKPGFFCLQDRWEEQYPPGWIYPQYKSMTFYKADRPSI